MKKLFIYTLCILCFSCSKTTKSAQELNNATAVKEKTMPHKEGTASKVATSDNMILKERFQKIIDSVQLQGAILLYNFKKDTYYSNDFEWAKKGQLPASTYKIPNSIIALETKVVDDQHTVFKWNGEKRMFKSWEEDLTLRQAFLRSCVPCYQEVARKIGVERMNQHIQKFKYGTITVDTTNLDSFWLQGKARITAFQQIDFLVRFQQQKLPISERTHNIVTKIMILKETDNYILRGKTGWSIEGDHHNGWFVGYVENDETVLFFATNVSPISKDFNQKKFQENRKVITYKALQEIGILL
jgi:beta-lactamase class D